MSAVDPEVGNASSLRFRKQEAAEPAIPSPKPASAAKTSKKTVPRWLANAPRSNFWSIKTRAPQWATIRSRWRFFEGLFFYLGPPLHMLRRIWPPMILNACVFALVAADHLMEAVSVAGQQQQKTTSMVDPKMATATDPLAGRRRLMQHSASSSPPSTMVMTRSLFPPLSASVAASLDPVFRLSIFVVSLLLTLRVGRAYERWWQARTSFQALGSLALTLTQRAEAWFCTECNNDNDAAAGDWEGTRAKSVMLSEDIARWSIVWQCSVYQMISDSKSLYPAARKLLKPAELALYDSAAKGRQLAAGRMTHLLVNGPKIAGRKEEINQVTIDVLLRAGVTAAGGCTGIKLQCLPGAVTITSTGVTEAFLLLYPLSALSVGGRGGGGAHDASVDSVVFTLAIQFLLYLFVCLLFLGMTEVASSLEDPFTGGHLPLEDMVRTTIRDVANARKDAAKVRRLGIGGERVKEGDDDDDDDVEVFESVDWKGALAICKRVT